MKKGENKGFGIALDLGTTTVAGSVVELGSGRVLASASTANPQSAWGLDVVSRIEAAARDSSALGALAGAARRACAGLIDELANGRREQVRRVALAGNTAMEHLFLGLSPEPLTKVPYRPASRASRSLGARDVGIDLDAELYVFPVIGGFAGGDAVAVALSLKMAEAGKPALAIDIGTNSEILLSAGGELYATSAAAGPAFEAGEVECGMLAGPGAIEGVRVEGDRLALDVIGSVAAKGICGSGLIEAASALLKAGVIDATGRIKDPGEVSTNLSGRIRARAEGNSFVLYRGAASEVALTQKDIRALQTAKSATRAGINLLLDKAGVEPAEVGSVYVAGAFGARLRAESLKTIGLLHDGWEGVKSVGDAALEGAALALTDSGRERAEALALKARYLPLSGSARFERDFLRCMNF